MRGGGRGRGSPDDAVQDLWGHEGAVEEGCVGHSRGKLRRRFSVRVMRGGREPFAGLVCVERGQVHAAIAWW